MGSYTFSDDSGEIDHIASESSKKPASVDFTKQSSDEMNRTTKSDSSSTNDDVLVRPSSAPIETKTDDQLLKTNKNTRISTSRKAQVNEDEEREPSSTRESSSSGRNSKNLQTIEENVISEDMALNLDETEDDIIGPTVTKDLHVQCNMGR